MSTPVKTLNFISKVKAVSPVSPRLSKNSIVGIETRKITEKRSERHLQVPETFQLQDQNCSNLNERCLYLNTPEKKNIQSHGLDGKKNLKILGHGTFGDVVRGVYNGIDVAIKIVKLRGNRQQITNRDENALNLNHENVVKTLDVIFKYNQKHGMVIMEYIQDSESLHNVILNKPHLLTFMSTKKYAINICNGLKYCHEHRILHLDLKPKNILVCWKQICKICDFGNSIKLGEKFEHSCLHGTPAYTAPEVFLGTSPMPACDIYSFGIILWQMQEKDFPYKDITCPEVIIYKVVKFNLRPALEHLKSKEYTDLYKKCWSPQPDDRPSLDYILETLLLSSENR